MSLIFLVRVAPDISDTKGPDFRNVFHTSKSNTIGGYLIPTNLPLYMFCLSFELVQNVAVINLFPARYAEAPRQLRILSLLLWKAHLSSPLMGPPHLLSLYHLLQQSNRMATQGPQMRTVICQSPTMALLSLRKADRRLNHTQQGRTFWGYHHSKRSRAWPLELVKGSNLGSATSQLGAFERVI